MAHERRKSTVVDRHPAASVRLEPAQLLVGADANARLVYIRDKLAAILTRMDDPLHDEDMGKWFVEIGFGAIEGRAETFADLDVARDWFARLA